MLVGQAAQFEGLIAYLAFIFGGALVGPHVHLQGVLLVVAVMYRVKSRAHVVRDCNLASVALHRLIRSNFPRV